MHKNFRKNQKTARKSCSLRNLVNDRPISSGNWGFWLSKQISLILKSCMVLTNSWLKISKSPKLSCKKISRFSSKFSKRLAGNSLKLLLFSSRWLPKFGTMELNFKAKDNYVLWLVCSFVLLQEEQNSQLLPASLHFPIKKSWKFLIALQKLRTFKNNFKI